MRLPSLERTNTPRGARFVAVGPASAFFSTPVWKTHRKLSASSWRGHQDTLAVPPRGSAILRLGVVIRFTEVLSAFLFHKVSHGPIALMMTLCRPCHQRAGRSSSYSGLTGKTWRARGWCEARRARSSKGKGDVLYLAPFKAKKEAQRLPGLLGFEGADHSSGRVTRAHLSSEPEGSLF